MKASIFQCLDFKPFLMIENIHLKTSEQQWQNTGPYFSSTASSVVIR
jgi:hypothetical protein